MKILSHGLFLRCPELQENDWTVRTEWKSYHVAGAQQWGYQRPDTSDPGQRQFLHDESEDDEGKSYPKECFLYSPKITELLQAVWRFGTTHTHNQVIILLSYQYNSNIRHVRLKKNFVNRETIPHVGVKLRIPEVLLVEKMRTQQRFNVIINPLDYEQIIDI